MPLPSNVGTGTVTGNYSHDDIAGVVLTTWKVRLTPSQRQFADVTATPKSVAFLKPYYEAALDSSGNLSMTVPATNDADLNPLDFTYLVTYAFPGLDLNPLSFYIEVPEGGTVNLPSVSPVQQSNGALIVQGIPTGGTTGQILGKLSGTSYDTGWIDPPAGGSGSSTLSGLTDVTVTSPASGQVLKYNGTEWINGTDNTGGGGGAWGSITGTLSAQTDLQAALDAKGTSNLTLGTTSTTAKAGDYAPAWGDVTGKPAVIAAGADAATARSAIGAGTSSLAIGTTGTTAMAGNKTAADLGGVTGVGITTIEKITQAAYDALVTKDPATLYVVV